MGTKEQIRDINQKVIKGLEETYRLMIEFKKRKNTPVIISKNGKVVEVDPNEILPTTKYKR